MARDLPKRVKTLANQLGVATREEVIKVFEGNAEKAAEEVRLALQRIVDEINNTTLSGVLAGYVAVKEVLGTQRITLPLSGVDVSGQYEWLIYVKAPADAKRNVFDILDEGRPELPFRDTPYPLWGAALRPSNIRREKRESMSRIRSKTPIGGPSPIPLDQRAAIRNGRASGQRGQPMVFSRGPISEVQGKMLYERALIRAKDRLKGSGFTQWDVILVQRDTRNG